MYVLIQKRNKKTALNIRISLTILTTIALIYIFHISVAKLLFDLCGFKYTSNEAKEGNISVTFIQRRDGDILEDVRIKKNFYNRKFRFEREKAAELIVESVAGRYPIVPNNVHYLRLNEPEFSFTQAICILSVYRNHVPSKIYIHTSNSSLSGPFWKKIQETKGLRLILKVIPVNISNYISGSDRNMNPAFTYNYLKLKILEQYGGIILNKDMFIVNNLDNYLRHEMTVHWNRDTKRMSDQIIIAKKNSHYLNKWIKGYRNQCLDVHNKSLKPFQYVRYIIGRRSYSAFVETFRFIINYSMMRLIYDGLHYNWQEKLYVVWLMEDLTKSKARNKVELYARQFNVNNDFSEQKLNETSEFSDSEGPTECIFLEMVKDVYY